MRIIIKDECENIFEMQEQQKFNKNKFAIYETNENDLYPT